MTILRNIYIYRHLPNTPQSPQHLAGSVTADVSEKTSPADATITFIPANIPHGLVNHESYLVCIGAYSTSANPGLWQNLGFGHLSIELGLSMTIPELR